MKLPPDLEAILSFPLPPELAVNRDRFLREYSTSVQEIRDRFIQAYGELVLHEIEYLVMCGWSREQTYLPAVNNLGVRRREMEDELVAAVVRFQGQLRTRLQRLLEERDDPEA